MNWTQDIAIKTNKMLQNEEYFKYIFKKTEKIACTVFYIVHNDLEQHTKDSVVYDLEKAAKVILDIALESLSCKEENLHTPLNKLTYALLTLESRLRVTVASGYIHADVLHVFVHEITSLHKTISKFSEGQHDFLQFSEDRPQLNASAKREPASSVQSVHKKPSSPQSGVSRRDTIRQFLKDNPGASIRDIAMVVTDCSEKTIQRELISMIKDSIVFKEGERRWSKYSLIES